MRATPKSASLTCPLLGDQQVGALDVAMAHAVLVQPFQTREHLPHVHYHEVLREAAEVFDDGGERAVLDILQHEVQVVGGAHRLEVPNDQRVLQLVEQVDFRLHLRAGRREGGGWNASAISQASSERRLR